MKFAQGNISKSIDLTVFNYMFVDVKLSIHYILLLGLTKLEHYYNKGLFLVRNS